MRILAAGSRTLPPRYPAARGSLPLQGANLAQPDPLRAVQACEGRLGAAALSPEGAAFSLSGLPAKRCRGLGAARRQNLALGRSISGPKKSTPPLSTACRAAAQGGVAIPRGFTLLELLLVISIMAFATAGVALSLRDPSETQLGREADRLAALLEGARAKSRAAGVPVRWRPVAGGFRFEGLPASDAMPTRWLDAGTRAFTPAPLLLGPEPLIAPQAVVLSQASHPARRLQVGTDGLRPFSVQAAP